MGFQCSYGGVDPKAARRLQRHSKRAGPRAPQGANSHNSSALHKAPRICVCIPLEQTQEANPSKSQEGTFRVAVCKPETVHVSEMRTGPIGEHDCQNYGLFHEDSHSRIPSLDLFNCSGAGFKNYQSSVFLHEEVAVHRCFQFQGVPTEVKLLETNSF